jgi:hypothetical protein
MADELEVPGASTQAQEPAAGGSGEVPQQTQQSEAIAEPAAEPTIADVIKRMEGFQREIGRFRGLQSQFDSLPKTVDSMFSKRLEQMQKEQYLNTLPPEARLDYQQQQEGQKQLEEFVMGIFGKKFPGLIDRYGDFTKFYERMNTQLESQDYFDQVAEALGENAERGIPEITKLFTELKSKVNSADPAEAEQAAKLRDLYANNPHAAALAVSKRMQQQVAGAAQGVIEQRRASASKSAIVPQGGAAMKAPTRLTRAQMNDKAYLESIAPNFTTEQWTKLLADSRA